MATTHNSKRLVLSTILSLSTLVAACSGNSPTAPSAPPPPPPPPACQANNTATVSFGNGTNLTLTVRWDGSIVGTIAPGQSTQPMTVSAGSSHRDEFIVANTNLLFCAGNPNFAQCSNNTITCTP